ncbi:MAG: hydroxymethylglutaryl-CoA synthase [Silicimonas sp.]|nr:hydroxymethylglutaryl-CoA synthase [Silicimonas sp.]
MTQPIGISALSFHTPHRYVALATLAEHHGIDPEKFSRGIGQDKIALPGHDEDVVTMAAEALAPVLAAHGTDGIDTLIFATETGIDQSKSAGIYLHGLMNLPANMRHVEVKQACYSATAALQMACAHVARHPDRKVLVIASDVARYDLDSSGEATQGAGAVAMLVEADPKILEIGTVSGVFTEDIMDFWRPNHRSTPMFDGKYSALRYLNALVEAWRDYQAGGGRAYEDFARFCYHLPFSRMGDKAHRHLAKEVGTRADAAAVTPGLTYNRQIGNCYTASLYLALISTLETAEEDLTGAHLGLFSYGSGATAEFFDATVVPGYRDHLLGARHGEILKSRAAVPYDAYTALWQSPKGADAARVDMPEEAAGRFRLAAIDDHKRIYADRGA